MSWEAVGAIGEVMGAVGVIATLAYPSIQIRQNSDLVRSSTRQAVSTSQMDIGVQLGANAEPRAAALRGLGEAPASSSRDEQLRDEMFIRAVLRTNENQDHPNQDGTFEDALWAGYVENTKRVLTQPSFFEWWQENRTLYSSDFAAFSAGIARGAPTQESATKVPG